MNRYRLLIIDDEASARETLDTTLDDQGYRLFFAGNGKDALKRLKETNPDLILLDVMMPEMTGYDVCRQIRSIDGYREIPIIFITALDDRDSLIQGIEAGGDDFVTKPFNRLEIITRIKGILRLNRYRKLEGERQRFQWMVQHADTGYLVINDEDVILYANPVGRMMLNIPEEKEGHMHQLEPLLEGEFLKKPLEAWEHWPQRSDEKEVHYLVKPETRESVPQWLEVHTYPLAHENQWMLQIRDISKDVELTMEVKKFHSLVSHKLNTPLNQVIPFLDLAAMSLEEGDLAGTREMVETAKGGAMTLHEQIQRVLRTLGARNISADRIMPVNELPEMIKTVCREHQLPENALNLTINPQTQCALTISAQNLEVILSEIIRNAIKHHPENQPHLHIAVICAGDNQPCRLTVTDNGIHLPSKSLRMLQKMAPYFQGEKFFTGQKSGMGLGLTDVKIMLWNIGGRLLIRNREDQPGVKIEIHLPPCRGCEAGHLA
ncbi:ATP-binding response regulator [Anoxynatronum buryatiense]|uniref:Stage 0 sporulation protein A homolog n=1 Tax=Anoxynatronum buryatiense TaxID=489973 RepID=A0AA46AJ81_9CLOT|nr:response regulator [Anoxynatronum buryatiense]SMP57865.1 Histidine kinase-, DNA gyrase B-, and HSP90-like ATPase [Anoxynatronum buryatiense]